MTQPTQTDVSGVDGVKGWLVVMLSTLSLKLVVENYLSYGILVDPVQIVIDSVNFLMERWWHSGLIWACCFQQMLHMYLIEKSMISNLISERTGMPLHALNSFFVGLGCSVIFYVIKFNPYIARLWMMFVLFTFTKSWSFACVNMMARRRQQKEKQANGAVTAKNCPKVVEYPHNVSLTNIISYMVFTPPVEYQLEFKRTEKRNIKILPITVLKLLAILFTIALIAYQYVVPELKKTSLHISQGNYAHLVICILKIVLPINLMWLLYCCVFGFKIYLPAYGEIVGMKGVIFQSEWWNAENIRDYWPKWNIPMFVCFKNNIVKPLLQMGYSRTTATAVVAICSGIMHEISLAHPYRIYNGLVFVSFVLQMPASSVNAWIAKRFGKGYGNFFLWFCLCSTHTMLTVFLYNSHNNL